MTDDTTRTNDPVKVEKDDKTVTGGITEASETQPVTRPELPTRQPDDAPHPERRTGNSALPILDPRLPKFVATSVPDDSVLTALRDALRALPDTSPVSAPPASDDETPQG